MALTQSRPPDEVIVVDASPEWDETRNEIIALAAASARAVRLEYVPAKRAALTVQCNQAIDMCTADVVFLIDDDSLMFPDCAEEVMRVYEADKSLAVLGVSPLHASRHPQFREVAAIETRTTTTMPAPTATLRSRVKALLRVESTRFLPYEDESPRFEVPLEVAASNVGQIHVMPGYAMTFRRYVFALERFCEQLNRYTSGEVQDLSH